LSTALVFLTRDRIAALRTALPKIGPVTLVDPVGDLTTV
jgi:hypothetical protein